MAEQAHTPGTFAFFPKEWGGQNRVVAVAVRGHDITGRVLIEYPGGHRDWIGPYGLYQDAQGDRIADRAAIAKAKGVSQ